MNHDDWKLAGQVAKNRPSEVPKSIKTGLRVIGTQRRRAKYVTKPDGTAEWSNKDVQVVYHQTFLKIGRKWVSQGYQNVSLDVTGRYGDKTYGKGLPYPQAPRGLSGHRSRIKAQKHVKYDRIPLNIESHNKVRYIERVLATYKARIRSVVSCPVMYHKTSKWTPELLAERFLQERDIRQAMVYMAETNHKAHSGFRDHVLHCVKCEFGRFR